MKVRLLLGALAAALVVLAVAQLVLPALAERKLRDDLAAQGRVLDADVSAFPAVKLLAGRADRVKVRMAEARFAGGELADLLDRARAAGELDARIDVMRVGPLLVRDLRLDKQGDRLHSEAAVSDADLRAALPADLGLRPVAGGGDGLTLEASAFGFAVRARLSVRDGALVIAPEGLLGGFATVTLFQDPRVRVTEVGARAHAGGFTMTADAQLD